MKYHVSKKFSSFDEFNSFTHGWDADFSASNRGECQAQIEHIDSSSVLINTGSYAQATIQRGTTPPGMHTFAIPFYVHWPMYWRNIPITTNSLMLFPKDRVLELSFKKYIGQSPKQYINHQRLRHCNEELRRISPQQKSVNQVAMSWGFWHMGQFSHDYKKLFGQTPGTTLAEHSGKALIQ
jgi:hypothetical protein